MKEHGLLFKGEMVSAMLREIDPKLQTRRPVTRHNSVDLDGKAFKPVIWDSLHWNKAQPFPVDVPGDERHGVTFGWKVPLAFVSEKLCSPPMGHVIVLPRIRRGHLVWVRETWAVASGVDGNEWAPKGLRGKDWFNFEDKCPDVNQAKLVGDYVIYHASEGPMEWVDDDGAFTTKSYWKPSLLMPRWASRLDLPIVEARGERLNDICEEDAKAEGVTGKCNDLKPCQREGFRHSYFSLWERINGPESLASNPRVWVYRWEKATVRGVKS